MTEGDRTLLLELPADPEWVDLINVTGNAAHCRPRRGTGEIESLCAIDESATELFLVENFDTAH